MSIPSIGLVIRVCIKYMSEPRQDGAPKLEVEVEEGCPKTVNDRALKMPARAERAGISPLAHPGAPPRAGLVALAVLVQ